MESDLISLRQLARRLQVSQTWLKAEARLGRIPSVAAGATYIFSASAVERALLERAACTAAVGESGPLEAAL